jgi:hypothetical protein
MSRFFKYESAYQLPMIFLNLIIVRLIMKFNKTLPNKIDLVLNREISLLVLLKNKQSQPNLFGIHSPLEMPAELLDSGYSESVMPTHRQS